jgi:V/A-type H+-transporting ATPase subunit K
MLSSGRPRNDRFPNRLFPNIGGLVVKKNAQKRLGKRIKGFRVALILLFFVVAGTGVLKLVAGTQIQPANQNAAEQAVQQPAKNTDAGVSKIAFMAAAIVVAIGSIAAGGAVGYVGAAAMGAIGEKPEIAGRALIFIGLAEGIAIYGLIIAIMILGKV